jgi:hypothetical protein
LPDSDEKFKDCSKFEGKNSRVALGTPHDRDSNIDLALKEVST